MYKQPSEKMEALLQLYYPVLRQPQFNVKLEKGATSAYASTERI